jgi:hypothetical protein
MSRKQFSIIALSFLSFIFLTKNSFGQVLIDEGSIRWEDFSLINGGASQRQIKNDEPKESQRITMSETYLNNLTGEEIRRIRITDGNGKLVSSHIEKVERKKISQSQEVENNLIDDLYQDYLGNCYLEARDHEKIEIESLLRNKKWTSRKIDFTGGKNHVEESSGLPECRSEMGEYGFNSMNHNFVISFEKPFDDLIVNFKIAKYKPVIKDNRIVNFVIDETSDQVIEYSGFAKLNENKPSYFSVELASGHNFSSDFARKIMAKCKVSAIETETNNEAAGLVCSFTPMDYPNSKTLQNVVYLAK